MNPAIAILEQAKRDIAKALVELRAQKTVDAAYSLQDADIALQVVRDSLREQRGLKQTAVGRQVHPPLPDRRAYPPFTVIQGGKL